jgi:hypothetical protein
MHTWFCLTQHLPTYRVGDAGSAENTPFVRHGSVWIANLIVAQEN